MSQFISCGRSGVSTVARGVLRAFERGEGAGHQRALAQTGLFVDGSARWDACEAERFEVLRDAVEALEGPGPERIQAGLYLLEHLAGGRRPAVAKVYTA